MEMFLSRSVRAGVALLAVVACVSSAHSQLRRETRVVERERLAVAATPPQTR